MKRSGHEGGLFGPGHEQEAPVAPCGVGGREDGESERVKEEEGEGRRRGREGEGKRREGGEGEKTKERMDNKPCYDSDRSSV